MHFRKYLLAILSAVFLAFGAVMTFWAYNNSIRWYHDTYVEPDTSGAEADEVLLWIQVTTALVSWIIGGTLLRKVRREIRTSDMTENDH